LTIPDPFLWRLYHFTTFTKLDCPHDTRNSLHCRKAWAGLTLAWRLDDTEFGYHYQSARVHLGIDSFAHRHLPSICDAKTKLYTTSKPMLIMSTLTTSYTSAVRHNEIWQARSLRFFMKTCFFPPGCNTQTFGTFGIAERVENIKDAMAVCSCISAIL